MKLEILTQRFHQKFGAVVFSGTLAIELALVASGFKQGDYVLLPNTICYRVLFLLVRMGAVPVIIKPQNGLVLSSSDVQKVMQELPVKFLIIVHQYGIAADIKGIKSVIGSQVTLIEDTAQAWDINFDGSEIGEYSDFVVTSFGPSKPLHFGAGGAVFTNSESLNECLDQLNNQSRYSTKLIYPYLFPESIEIDFADLMAKADRQVSKQREIADQLIVSLVNTQLKIITPAESDQFSWHRFPVWTEDAESFQTACDLADTHGVVYEKAFKRELQDLPILEGIEYKYFDLTTTKINLMLVKPSKNNFENIHAWTNNLK